ncbi:hypothetical protein KL950_003559 [Ogataea haglerorum]|uniref:Peroxisomal ATPase PEX6 n=1 Tax=Ogataea haglerorum TaxID=1937702 RepID=A0ABQ7RDD4_9ASCO|nr:hypothetical protein KL950_003559 [Ogataea haglerorum]KAG7741647.1 hypothetical protein KL923_000902 [Ogataea haglerorum]KAG7763680.1 hypothetical protein KL946_003781 [Ogataea haglerorum]
MPGLVESPIEPYARPVRAKVQLALDSDGESEYVSLNSQVYKLIYGDSLDNKTRFVSLQLLGSPIFVESQLLKAELDSELPQDSIELHSPRISSNYGSDFTLENCIIVPVTKVLSLTSVIMGFPRDVYKLLEGVSKERLFELIGREKGSSAGHTLIRKNDFLRTLHGEIIHCEPVDQGFLSLDTNLVILKQQEGLKSGINTKIHRSRPGASQISISTPTGFSASNLNLGDLAFDDTSIFSNLTLQPFELQVSFLKYNTLMECTHILGSSHEFDHEDDQLFACVCSSVLQRIGCFSGDLVQLQICDCGAGIVCACDKSAREMITIRVFSLADPNDFDPENIYLSPVFLNAIGNPRRVFVKRLCSQRQNGHLVWEKLENHVPLAKEVVIARVASPITLDRTMQHLFLSNLKSYFESKHRVIMKDQYIPVPIDTVLAKSLFSTYNASGDETQPTIIPQGIPNELAWFKITEGTAETNDGKSLVAGTQYIIDPLKTRMIQSGICPDKVPLSDGISYSQLRDYLELPRQFAYPCLKISNVITFPYANQLRKIVNVAFRIRDNSCERSRLQTTILLSSMTRCVGKATVVRRIATEIGANLLELDAYDILNQSSVSKTIGTIKGKSDRVVETCCSVILFVRHIEALAKKPDPNQQQKDSMSLKLAELIDEYTSKGVIFIGSTNDTDAVSELIRSKFKFEINVNVPTDSERKLILTDLLDNLKAKDRTPVALRSDVSLDTLALQSAGLTANDLVSIVDNTIAIAIERLERLSEEQGVNWDQILSFNGGSIKLTPEDFEASINDARNKFSDMIGAPRIPDVKWEDVGGLDVIKEEILDTIEMPLKHPELFSRGMKKRSGILFYGPPGTGKTLLAKAIATNFALNFFSVKGPELLNMYIGESEANVRRVFQKARDAKPCVIFFDELDSVAPKRGNQGDSGGVMDRIVSQLLAELDGMSGAEGGDGVFVVGATNRPDLLDEALLRPGRFDKMLYLGIADTHEKQAKIIQALTRKFQLDHEVDLNKIAETCPFTYTGADFYALCSDAMLNAMTRTAGTVEKKINEYNRGRGVGDKISTRFWFDNIAKSEDTEVLVKAEDFAKARDELVPSVSAEELQHYLSVREKFEGGKTQEIVHEAPDDADIVISHD